MTTPEGQGQIRELARGADIVIENFKVGGLRKYGLDAHSLRAINPRLVYCSITGFGQTGPYADRAGYDFMIQRSEEHTSELQSLMRSSYAVFCLKKKKQ